MQVKEPDGTSAVSHWSPETYARLRQIAGNLFRGLPAGHTLQPTALVHEVYLKLADQEPDAVKSRAHFVSMGARTMRQVLVDHYRRTHAGKRGGARRRVTLYDISAPGGDSPENLLALDQAIDALSRLSQRSATVVEMKFFCGSTTEEIAAALDVSLATVEREWRSARAWLRVWLDDADPDAEAS